MTDALDRSDRFSGARSASGFAAVNGARLWYEVAGEGPAVVLLHAGIADSRMWDAQFSEVARTFRVVRYDARGYGRSTMPVGAFAREQDLWGLLRVLGIERAALVGCSMGGATAIDVTLTYPNMVTALVLVASALGGYQWSEAIQRYDEEEEAAMARGDTEAVIELNIRFWVDGPSRTPDLVNAAVREAVRGMLRDASTSTDGPPRRLEPPALERLGEVRVPTLVIDGNADVADIAVIADRLTAGIAGARRATMHNAAHMLSMQQPAAFNRLTLEFLEQAVS